jgi:2-amino-4-hydroxy-6-hydroxymethyldihydropteridine diphosphokinase
MPHALLALGSNLGDRAQTLDDACRALAERGDIRLLRNSHWHTTQPIGGPADQDDFLNGAALVETSLSPTVLHTRLKALEAQAGRQQSVQWAARPLDVDLLLYDDLVLASEQLEIPHPRMSFRRFVLQPATEVAPEMVHPVIGWTMRELLDHLNRATPYMAVTGPNPSKNVDLAKSFAEQVGARYLPDPAVDSHGVHSPSLLMAKELELIGKRGALLDQSGWGTVSQWTVTPFWLGESLAYGEAIGLEPAQQRQLAGAVAIAQSGSVRPKLLVLVDAELEAMDGARSPSVLQARLQQCAQQPGVGPLLRIESASQITAQDQIRAAVDAMA